MKNSTQVNKKQLCKHRHSLREHPRCFPTLFSPPKAIFLDLEISPQESMTYGNAWEASVQSVVRPPYVFCFSYMDIRAKRAKVVSLPDFPLYKRDPYDDREVVKKLHEIMSGADYVIAHNIRFDMRVSKARFIKHKLKPIFPKQVCTLKLARKIAQFPSNTLKELAIFLGVKHKMDTSKHLWEKIHFFRDPKAWREMCLYNRIDSEVGTEIYNILEAWSEKPLLKPIKK